MMMIAIVMMGSITMVPDYTVKIATSILVCSLVSVSIAQAGCIWSRTKCKTEAENLLSLTMMTMYICLVHLFK